MERRGKEFLVLYLTDWQVRMIKDFLGVDCHRWVVPFESGPVVRYGVRTSSQPGLKRMYLTDWQKREIKDVSGEACDFIELEKGAVTDYGVLPE